MLANPSWLTAWAVKMLMTLSDRGGTVDQSGLVVFHQPQLWFPVPAHILIRITSLVQRALDPSSHSKPLGPACAPRHCGPPPHWSSASSVGNRPVAPDKTAGQTPMPPNRPTPNTYSHSSCSPTPSTSRYSSIGSAPSDNTTHSPPPSQIG